MFTKIWTSLSNIGIHEEDNVEQRKRITFINQYLVIALFIYLINGLSDSLLGYYKQGLILVSSAMVVGVFLFLNKKRYHRFSIIALYLYISLTVFYFGSQFSHQTGDYLYFFTLVLCLSFVFDFDKDKRIIIALFLFTLVLILLHTYNSKPSLERNLVKETIRYKMFILNLIVNFLGLGFFIYLTIRNNNIISELYMQQLKTQHESNEIIKKTLLEKEILLAELHHRVKNNLAVIVSFLNLKMNASLNEEARIILMESRNHVNSIALIHNRLYKTDNLSEINFHTYIEDLLIEIQQSYPLLAKTVKVSHTIDDVKLDLVRAVPCALILNELLTNCYKHAFTTKKEGSIQINFKVEHDGKMSLLVIDDGAGLIQDYDKKNSLGISIINGLSEQLNGECRFYNNNGTCFSLLF